MLLSNPQSPSQNPHHLRPKNPRCRPAPPSSRGASSERYNRRVAEPASIVAFSPYLPVTRCRFIIVEPAVPLPSLGATVLRHLPVEPTAVVVFSWSQWSALPPTISSMAISSLLVAAAHRLLHTSPIVTDVYDQGSKLPQVFQSYF
uniref:Uncharacterized protein n=1 Tax=Oryza glumipatula TaxID=40148 RepID=A0A0D9ZJ35_9ORYZ